MEAEGPLPDSDSENDNEEEEEADDQEEHVVGAFGASSLKAAPLKGCVVFMLWSMRAIRYNTTQHI